MKSKALINIGKTLLAVLSAILIFYAFLISSLVILFGLVDGNISMYIVAILAAVGIIIEAAVIGLLWGAIKKKAFYIPLGCAVAVCAAALIGVLGYQRYVDSIPTVGESGNLLLSYAPYAENSKTVSLDEESWLKITEDLPQMDGATALYPVYSAFAKAVYPKEALHDIVTGEGDAVRINKNDYLKCSTTTEAYYNIVTGDADIIFAALPSEEQKQFAAENGVELIYTPIGKEAFVFFVNAKNPIENITLDEIVKIYSGETTKWTDLGVSGLGEIKAFQRDEGSGSQSTLERLMAEKPLMTPPKENVVSGMGGIIEKTADYRNYKNAIGYTFRFYAAEMAGNTNIKLLRINGAEPVLESIEDGTYPIASYFYAVTRSDADENTLALLEWIRGEQGQKIIEMTGYIPLQK